MEHCGGGGGGGKDTVLYVEWSGSTPPINFRAVGKISARGQFPFPPPLQKKLCTQVWH